MPNVSSPGPVLAAGPYAPVDPADRRFGLAIGLGFLVVAGFITAHHEPWRDEMQAWLLARDSPTVGLLLRNMRYEGHPPLWQLLLFAIQRTIGSTPAAMQALNVLLAAAAVAIFAACAPFNRGQRALFAMGFFPLYMYGVIARDYALTLLCLFAAVALVARRREHPIALAIALVALCWTTIYGLILALALVATLFLEGADTRWPRGWAMLVVAAAALSAWQVHPPPDSGYAVGWNLGFDLERVRQVLFAVGDVFFPLKPPYHPFGHPPWLRNTEWTRWVAATAGCAALVWAGVTARRTPLALRFHLVAVGGLLAFFYTKFIGEFNHHGFVLVAVLCTLWLAASRAGPPGLVLTALLLVQAVATLVPAVRDARSVFSYGRAVAELLERDRLDHGPLIGYPDAPMASILGYLPGRTAFFPGPDREGTFTIWDQARLRQRDDNEIVATAESLASRAGRPAVLVVTHVIDHPMAEPLARFVGGYVGPDEDFYLYRILPRAEKPGETRADQ